MDFVWDTESRDKSSSQTEAWNDAAKRRQRLLQGHDATSYVGLDIDKIQGEYNYRSTLNDIDERIKF